MSIPQLYMSLDDIIKSKTRKNPAKGNRRHRRFRSTHSTNSGTASGPFHRFSNSSSFRTTPHVTPLMVPMNLPEGMHPILTGGSSDPEKETKLYISNLDYDVSNSDMEILFSDVGELERCSIHCDKSGRSKGTAEVVFARRTDAIAAIKRYNNVQLDGKPMKIDIIGDTQTTPAPPFAITGGILGAPPRVDTQTTHAPPLPITDGILGAPPRVYIRDEGWDYRSCSSNSNNRASSSWGQDKRQRKLYVEDLDADLDRYRAKAKKIL